jgi:hypothetical protein
MYYKHHIILLSILHEHWLVPASPSFFKKERVARMYVDAAVYDEFVWSLWSLYSDSESIWIQSLSMAAVTVIRPIGLTVNIREIRIFASSEMVDQYRLWNLYSP